MKDLSITKTITLLGLISFLTSCGTASRTYTNATMGSTANYVAKPEYNGENESAIYVSGEFGGSNISNDDVFLGYHDTGSTTFGSFNIHRALAQKDFNLYYGVGAQYGRFNFAQQDILLTNDTSVSTENKEFYAFQAKAGINYLISKSYADFRIIGIDLGYISEFGPYMDTLDQLKANEDFLPNNVRVNRRPSNFYLGLSSEVIFKLKNDNAIGINPFIAKSFLDQKKGLEPNSFGITLSYRHSNFTFSFLNEINSQERVEAHILKLGLSYKLN